MNTRLQVQAKNTPTASFIPGRSNLLPDYSTKQAEPPLALPILHEVLPTFQAKLTIGQPNDRYEQEADRVAEQVMRMPKTRIQRVCPECEEELQRQPMEEEEEEEETLQTKPLAEQITPLVQRQAEPMEEEEEEETIQTKIPSGQTPTLSSSLQNRITALQGGGQPLPHSERAFFEPRFGTDFSQVRVHSDTQAADMARAVNARAFTVGHNVVFGSGQYSSSSSEGRHLLAHELTHVVQQESPHPYNLNNRNIKQANTQSIPMVQRRAAPYIKKITVHLKPSQTADLEWKGTPPADAPGSDSFQVSTGKGYSDPGDPPGTCIRSCCSNPDTQCAPPWNKPSKVGACCTFYGKNFWTGKPREEHNGWKWWTPIQPHYSSRGIALHEHPTVTGQPIGHGCVRMEEPNAKRIYEYSNRKRTNVTIDGHAAPVACEEDRRCAASGGSGSTVGTRGASVESLGESRFTSSEAQQPIAGLEGVMS